MKTVLILLLLAAATPVVAQDRPTGTENPLAQLKDEVQRVLGEASLPFTEDQEKAITLMMEDRRKASEDLFGGLMDFSAGPTRGQEADRLNSALDWMRGEFLGRLQDYLTPQQLSIWSRYRETTPAAGDGGAQPGQPVRRPQQNQTQFVRINNNPFTAEDNFYRNRGGGGGNFGGGGGGNFGGGGGGNDNRNQNQGGAEVIQRGGAGAWHGNAQILLKDEALNAGRRFADNKPPYQERQLSFDVGGPVLPGRLTTNFGINQNRAENVDTINATLPDGIFALGITKPSTFRGINVRNTLQVSDRHSLSFNGGKRSNKNENQNVGGFTMPERASDNKGGNWNLEVKQFSAFSAQRIYETRFNYNTNHNETLPRTEGLRIDVTDAFSSGGAQNKSENKGWNYEFGNLYTQLGERLTIKTGIDGVYRKRRQSQETNFTGTFKFSSLESFVAGQPISFRVNQGNPLLELGQWEVGFFFQNDFKLTPRFTLMTGARYSIQTNIGGDHNNLDPRIGLAYAVGRATVIRAGAGIFTGWIQDGLIADQWRQDGTRQHEIIIDNPSYPDPFKAGTVRNTAPSIRVIDPNLTQPYTSVAMVSYERTFLTNLFISAAYDFSRDIHRIRYRNLNAPRDITSAVPASCKLGQSSATCVRPDPSRGNIINLEASGSETFNTLRLNYRQRLSAFNVSAGYTMTVNWTDTIQNGGNGNNNVSQFGFSSEGLPSDSYNLRADWARGAQPLHNLNASVNYQLPLGLFLSGTVNSTSSRKYTVTTGTDDNQDTSVNDRPAGEPRNGRPTPNFLNFDFNISKAFFFGAGTGGTRTNVNVFANMTNAFNRPNYGIPSGVMTSPNFQRSTNAGNPREIEVGLRFQF